MSKFDTDVLFPSGEAELNPSARKMFGEFADIFQLARGPRPEDHGGRPHRWPGDQGGSPAEVSQQLALELAARAVAVVERLREAGMPQNRMGIAGFAEHQPISPNDTATSRKRNRRVEIFVVGPETPVVGWTETLGSVYR